MTDKDEFEVLLGHDEVSEDESEGDMDEINYDDLELDDFPPDAEETDLLDELFEED